MEGSAKLTLPNGLIHIWTTTTKVTTEQLDVYKSLLSEAEQKRIGFFKFPKVQRSYVVTQAVQRILLARYLNIPIAEVSTGRKPKGKPFCQNDNGLFFNTSNSGSIVAFAFTRACEVGIDIEQIRTIPDLDILINANFNSSEVEHINANNHERLNRFFKFWTIKESYLKAIGEGMRLPPKNIEFSIDRDRIRLLFTKGICDQDDLTFLEFTLKDNYVGTLTYSGEATTVKQFQFHPDSD